MSTLAEIQSQIQAAEEQVAQLRKQAEQAIQAERQQALAETRAKVKLYGFTASELGVNAARGKAAPSVKAAPGVKYRNELGETWSGGRGRKPQWVKDVLASGQDIEKFAV